jgi:hypothetical protein
MKFLYALLLIVFCLAISPVTANAKVLPQAAKSTAKTVVRNAKGTTIGVAPRLRADRKAIIVSFSNLQNAKSVSYSLVYAQGPSGQQEGAGGGLQLAGKSSDKAELLFGTCSAGVCRYHTGIKDARLEVSYISTTGKKYLKKFKIKI